MTLFSSNWRPLTSPDLFETISGTLQSVEIAEILSHTFQQKFRESNGFTKEITK